MIDSIGISYVPSIGQTYAEPRHITRVAKLHNTGFWERLEEALISAGYKDNFQTAVTKLIKIKQPSVYEWQQGISMPSMSNVVKLALKLNADVQYLYTGVRSRNSIPPNDKEAVELWAMWPDLPATTRGRLLGIAQEALRQQPNVGQDNGDSSELQRA